MICIINALTHVLEGSWGYNMSCRGTVNCKNCKIRGKEGVDEKKASSEEIPVALLFFEHGSDDSDSDGFIFEHGSNGLNG